MTQTLQSPAIAVDDSGAAYVTATGVAQTLITAGGFDGGALGTLAFFQVAPSGSALSYVGQFGAGNATSIAIDGSGGVYLAASTDTANFPTTTGAYQTAAQTKTQVVQSSGILRKSRHDLSYFLHHQPGRSPWYDPS